MIKITVSDKKTIEQIYKLDKKFYGDNFFTLIDIKRMASGKTKNKIYVDDLEVICAYIILFKMPSGATYITSLAGAKKARRYLLEKALSRFRNRRIYTHGREKWGMDLFREFGFKNKGRGDPADEEVPFGDDIRRLTVYELFN